MLYDVVIYEYEEQLYSDNQRKGLTLDQLNYVLKLWSNRAHQILITGNKEAKTDGA